MTLPNFLIVGAAKAGTTSLYNYLKQHPQIYMSPVKEPKFFAVEGEDISFQGPRDLSANRHLIANFSDYQKLFENVTSEIAIGEASPWYLYRSKAAERIQHYIPEAKLIAILRNPVDRAFSNYVHMTRYGRETLDFAQALQSEEERIQNRWEPHWHYKQAGYYYNQLKGYFDRFDREQIKVYLYEDFSRNQHAVLKDIFNFLGVDESFSPDLSQRAREAKLIPKNQIVDAFLNRPNLVKSFLKPLIPTRFRQGFAQKAQKQNLTKPKVSPEIRQQLIQDYREDIFKLEELLQKDLSHWLQDKPLSS